MFLADFNIAKKIITVYSCQHMNLTLLKARETRTNSLERKHSNGRTWKMKKSKCVLVVFDGFIWQAKDYDHCYVI